MINHETPRSTEAANQDVFDSLVRASAQEINTINQYHIGDGLSVEIGWVANIVDGGTPGLIVSLNDSIQGRRISLSVDQEVARYNRSTQPAFIGLGWLAASREERHAARLMTRRASCQTPTVTLESVASAVANHRPYSGEYMSETTPQDQITVEPLPDTDIARIRGLINEFTVQLD